MPIKVRAKAPVPKAPKKSKVRSEPRPKGLGATKGDATELLEELSKTVGDGNALNLSGGGMHIKIRGVIPTTCFGIDDAIGRGGVPRGRLTILHGGEGGGKTTLLLHLMAQVQRMGGIAVYIDAEYKLDPEYAESLGVDLESMIYVAPDSLESAMDAINDCVKFARSKREERGESYPMLIALDSMNAATPKSVLDGEPGDHHMAPHARAWSQELPKIIKAVSKEDIALIFVSQLRKKIGIMFGDDSEIAGGNAPKHHASLVMFVSRTAKIKDPKDKDRVIGNRCKLHVKKNQIAPPFRKVDFTIWYGKGIDGEVSLLEACEQTGKVEKSGTWYSIDGEKIGQGLAQAAEYLRKNVEIRDMLEDILRKMKGW